MSLLDDALGAAMGLMFDTGLMAESVTYNTASIPAHFAREEAVGGDGRAERGVLEVRVSDVPAPAYRDAVVVGGETWRVLRVIGGDGYTWRIELAGAAAPLRR